MIQHLQHKDIDKAKWDHCIKTAVNSLIYGYSFYLDAVAGQWNAIIINDYEAVMPLVWRRKFSIPYLYQPPFTQQLGIFFKQSLTGSTCDEIKDLLYEHYRFAEVFLNYANNKCTGITAHTNFVLNINKPYKDIYAAYEHGFTKSLRRIAKFSFQYTQANSIDEAIILYRTLYGSRVKHLTERDYAAFKKLCHMLQQNNMLEIRQAVDNENNPLALTLLFKDEKRLYNIISCVTGEGKRKEVNYFLYDNIIREFCNNGLVLDLEGSDIKGVAGFYKKMNPEIEPYFFYKFNHLPVLLRLFKK